MKRLPSGGAIDRSRPIRFRWDGRELTGYAGDTLASALLGAGIRVLGRSVTLGRPRGITAAGAEEAHGFAQVSWGGGSEPLIRTSAVELLDGLRAESRITKGRLTGDGDGARFDKRYGFADLLVVGAGPAGLAAAAAGCDAGLRVILAEQEPILGGALRAEATAIAGVPPDRWIEAMERRLEAEPEVRILRRTTATMQLDGNGMILVERLSGGRGQRLWQVRATGIILATGALERPIVFPDNDRPGIMLARAARVYLARFGLAPERGLVFTTTDDGYRTALAWSGAGVTVAGVVDPRPAPAGELVDRTRAAGIPVLAGAVVVGTDGDEEGGVAAAIVSQGGRRAAIDCDVLAVSGGFDPALNLHQQRRGPTRWDARLLCEVPAAPLEGQRIVGAAAGRFLLHQCLPGREVERIPEGDPAELWQVPAPDGDESRSFVDSHRDATVADLDRAVGAGIRHIEHLKRYTLIGTGVEQGRAAKVNAAAIAALAFRRPVADVGTSSARPPAEPMMFRTVAGRAAGARYEPIRTTPIHPAHVALGAVFEPVGQWLRPRSYPRAGESLEAAILREQRAVREAVGIVDVSTLGKIDVQGPDAAEFLDRLYTNPIGSLAVGKARYSLMCRLDGVIFDDGVVMRLAPDRFFVTTSTGHAAAVLDWMEDWLQSEWPDLRVWLTSITEQWATVAIAGPRSREVMAALAPELDCSREGFPFLAVRRARVAGIEGAQVARVSFSGELAYEVSVPGGSGGALWEAALAAGAPFGITPYGTEALSVLRAEKGYLIVGQESDATTIPGDVGLGWLLGRKEFLGKRALTRPDLLRPGRKQLVGFLPEDPAVLVPDGAAIVTDPGAPRPVPILGHVTASHRSATLDRTFGLAMVAGGSGRHGERVHALAGERSWPIVLGDPVRYDRDGTRRDG